MNIISMISQATLYTASSIPIFDNTSYIYIYILTRTFYIHAQYVHRALQLHIRAASHILEVRGGEDLTAMLEMEHAALSGRPDGV